MKASLQLQTNVLFQRLQLFFKMLIMYHVNYLSTEMEGKKPREVPEMTHKIISQVYSII